MDQYVYGLEMKQGTSTIISIRGHEISGPKNGFWKRLIDERYEDTWRSSKVQTL